MLGGGGGGGGTGLFTTAGRFLRCSGLLASEPTISLSRCFVEISYQLLHRINRGSEEREEALAAGRKGLAAKKKKAKHPGDKTADWTVKKEGRKERIKARGENEGQAERGRETHKT